jgi:pyruvate/2-oxoglutarate dehydrogenase complex dihydrolipoamide dehydrogenase (E3) component
VREEGRPVPEAPVSTVPARERYDLIVIGAGAGGLVTAGGAAQLGAHVLLVEQHRLGGECLWTGCVPSKAVIAVAAQPGRTWADARAAVQAAITTIEPHDSPGRFQGFGVEVIKARAQFLDVRSLDVGGKAVTARRIVLATGSDPAIPPLPGLADLPCLTNDTVFDLETQPRHLLVIGGGAIGCELGQAFARLGSAVTLIANGPLLPRQDEDAVAVVRTQLQADGIRLIENAEILRASSEGNGPVLHLAGGGSVSGSHILIAAGRRARTSGLGLEKAGVRTGANGICTDAWLRTSNRRIYAVGDCREGPRLTHAADQDARTVIQNALFPFGKRKNYTALPAAVYCDPELAQVGLTEAEARAGHSDIQLFRHDFDHNDRAVTDGDTRGFVKIVARGKRVLGVTIVGAQAGELLALASFAVSGTLSLADFAAQTFAYPTRIEALRHAAEQPGQKFLFSAPMQRLTRLFQHLP